MLVGASYREQVAPARTQPPSIAASLASLAANRAFVTLNLAMMAMIVAVTILNKSVLYYFKYFIGDDVAGQSALAWMGVVGAAAVPLWMLLQRLLGTRGCGSWPPASAWLGWCCSPARTSTGPRRCSSSWWRCRR